MDKDWSAKVKNGDPDQKGMELVSDRCGWETVCINIRNDYYQIKNKQDIGMKIEAVFSETAHDPMPGRSIHSVRSKKAEVDVPN